MISLKGKYNEAICYTDSIELEASSQISELLRHDFVKDSKIRIMPDVHAGKGCTIGTTMTITDKIVPNLVGVDIGCGMLVMGLWSPNGLDLAKIDKAIHSIPSGRNVWELPQEKFDLTRLRCYGHLKRVDYLLRSIGTLGGGNHFIEIEEDIDGNKYLVIHSGSRNLGKQVAEYYQNLAIELNQGKEDYYKKRQDLINTYKAQGREKELEEALKELKCTKKDSELPDALCYLYGKSMEDYLHDITICQDFADLNRRVIANKIIELSSIDLFQILNEFTTRHNYIDMDKMILRKGAVSARKNEVLLIPLNMRDGSILAVGKGNPEWNYSAPHGAGRLMSRAKARENLSMEDFKFSMKNVYTTSINEVTLDEAPMAYKPMEEIINNIKDTVDIITVLKPIYNFKADN